MGQDTKKWKQVAQEADESPNRTQKRAWLCAIREVLVEELRAVIANEADVGVDADGFRLRCRGLLERIPDPYWGTETETETETSLTPQERVAVYLAGGVSWWVHNDLREMTNMAASTVMGIGYRSTYTYTTDDGSTITLNMGRDMSSWRQVAKEAVESPSRTQKRAWLCAIREVLVEELRAVIANEADVGVDANVFKARCRGLLERIPDPYWGERGDTAPPPL
jgi:hypothetical protein